MHKRGWLEYLLDGDLVFSPGELHSVLRTVIDCDPGKPKGDKLFHLRKSFSFTMTPDKIPYRTEEALERFIVVSNGDNFYNQIPIGGGKESIDIGVKESESEFTFIELKPWGNKNSPLYALVESLKNLLEYRIILERNLANVPRFSDVNLLILAPFQYYERHCLVTDSNIATLQRTVSLLSEEFQTAISFMALDIEMESFLNACRSIYERQGLRGQVVVDISNEDPVRVLSRTNWRLIAAP